jgi:hypothetical protein
LPDPALSTLHKEDHQMNKQKEMHAAPTSEQQKRQLWIKPVVQKIKAGEAEVGTRSNADGAFTSS